MSKKTQNGGEKINLGGILQHWVHLGPLGSFNMKRPTCLGELISLGRACCFCTKPPAHLGELGGKLLLHFPYKMALEAEGKGFNTFGNQISLKISEEKKKEGENQGRGASITLPWHFHDQFRERSSPFFIGSSSFVDLQSVSFQFSKLWIHSCFCMFSSSSRLLLVFFFFV